MGLEDRDWVREAWKEKRKRYNNDFSLHGKDGQRTGRNTVNCVKNLSSPILSEKKDILTTITKVGNIIMYTLEFIAISLIVLAFAFVLFVVPYWDVIQPVIHRIIDNQLWIPILVMICIISIPVIERVHIDRRIHKLANNAYELTPKQFFKLRKVSFGGKGRPSYVKRYDFEGIYILLNKTKGMYYVGQSVHVFQRVNAHFTGHGNPDVYYDYRNGNDFIIRMISLKNSGYQSLNELERNAISTYHAYTRGYNKTRGNCT